MHLGWFQTPYPISKDCKAWLRISRFKARRRKKKKKRHTGFEIRQTVQIRTWPYLSSHVILDKLSPLWPSVSTSGKHGSTSSPARWLYELKTVMCTAVGRKQNLPCGGSGGSGNSVTVKRPMWTLSYCAYPHLGNLEVLRRGEPSPRDVSQRRCWARMVSLVLHFQCLLGSSVRIDMLRDTCKTHCQHWRCNTRKIVINPLY